jgi:transposase InsO family protein
MRGHKRLKTRRKPRKTKRLRSGLNNFLTRIRNVMVLAAYLTLLKKEGIDAGRYKVCRIMTKLGLSVRYPKRFKVTTDSHHNEAISANKLARQFTVIAPNKVWTTDITYVWMLEG